jgi:hypothetical protein
VNPAINEILSKRQAAFKSFNDLPRGKPRGIGLLHLVVSEARFGECDQKKFKNFVPQHHTVLIVGVVFNPDLPRGRGSWEANSP